MKRIPIAKRPMTYQAWKKLGRSLTNRELSALDAEMDQINSDISNEWIDDADEERIHEIQRILRESYRLARIRELGWRVIEGGAA